MRIADKLKVIIDHLDAKGLFMGVTDVTKTPVGEKQESECPGHKWEWIALEMGTTEDSYFGTVTYQISPGRYVVCGFSE